MTWVLKYSLRGSEVLFGMLIMLWGVPLGFVVIRLRYERFTTVVDSVFFSLQQFGIRLCR